MQQHTWSITQQFMYDTTIVNPPKFKQHRASAVIPPIARNSIFVNHASSDRNEAAAAWSSVCNMRPGFVL